MGLYTSLENKYYSVLEKIDKFVPILSVTDKIDQYVPSFMVFLALFLVVIVLILAFVLLSIQPSYDVEISVLTLAGNPIEGAVVIVEGQCSNTPESVPIATNKEGKVSLKVCATDVLVSVTKDGYKPASTTLDFSEEKNKFIKLSPNDIPQRKLNVKIVNDKSEIISKAKLTIICTKGNDVNRTDVNSSSQPTSGYLVMVPSSCSLVQLKATAQGYEDNTITLGANEERTSIPLTKIILQGTTIFTADSPLGLQKDASIIITDAFNHDQQLFTSTNGQVTKLLSEGEYSYTAMAKGVIESGSFTVIANQTIDVNIFFSDLRSDQTQLDTTKNVYLKIVDGNTPLSISSAKIFFKKGNDTNFFTQLNSNYEGIMGPLPILDLNQKTFYAVIKANGYQTKLIDVNLHTKSEGPQVIQMTQGGAKLTLSVIDDQNKPLQGVQTVLYISGFGGYFDKANETDKNGVTYYFGLPTAAYTIIANTDTDEGTLNLSISRDTNATLRMITGSGTVTFNFYDEEGKVSPTFDIYNGQQKIESAVAVSGKFTTSSIKAESMLHVVITDENFMSYESFEYQTKRGTMSKSLYLRRKESLPNNNETQLILRQIFESNPIYATESVADSLMPGSKYYFLYDLVLNKDLADRVVTNFFVGPDDKNIITGTETIVIDSAYSLNDVLVVMTSNKKSMEIDVGANPDAVDSNAKQLNATFSSRSGYSHIPILVEVRVDNNTTNKVAKVSWQSKFGSYLSLAYSKEFTIGEKFCLGSACPAFLFSNYLKWGNRDYRAIDDSVQTLQLGDSYVVKTIVQNLTDQSLGDANLVLAIDKQSTQTLLFSNFTTTPDKNKAKQSITLNPLMKAAAKEFTLNLVNSAYGSVKTYESVEKYFEGSNLLLNYEGNQDEFMRFEVRNKNDLNITIVATSSNNVMYSNAYYPVFIVKTQSTDGMNKTKSYISAHWTATIEGEESVCQSVGCSGTTDANGIQVTSFDASNLPTGTKIIFEATDDNGSNPARLEVTLTDPFPPEPVTPTECVKVWVNGVDLSSEIAPDFPTLNIDLNYTSTFTVTNGLNDSACTEDKLVVVYSDLGTLPKQFTLAAGASQAVSVDASATVLTRGGMIGAYPVQVLSVGKDDYTQVGYFDAIVSDSTIPFYLSQYIFDFRTADKVDATVTNRTYSGRMDNYYPQMEINTETVALEYDKPELPHLLTLTAKVYGEALEELDYALTKSDYTEISSAVPGMKIIAPSEIKNDDDFEEYTEAYSADGNYLKPEPDLDETNPSKSFYDLPVEIQEKIISQMISPTGSASTVTGTAATSPYVVVVKKSNAGLSTNNSKKVEKLNLGTNYLSEEKKSDGNKLFFGCNGAATDGCAAGTYNNSGVCTSCTLPTDSNYGRCGGNTIVTNDTTTAAPAVSASGNTSVPNVDGPLHNQLIPVGTSAVMKGQLIPGGGFIDYCSHITVPPMTYTYGCLLPPPKASATKINGTRKYVTTQYWNSNWNTVEYFYSNANDMNSNVADELEIPEDYEMTDPLLHCGGGGGIQNYVVLNNSDARNRLDAVGNADAGDEGDCTGPRTFLKFYHVTGTIYFQTDSIARGNLLKMRQKIWTKDYNITDPVEGKVYDLGAYDATPEVEWTSISDLGGREADDEWAGEDNLSFYTVPLLAPIGFVPWERALEGFECKEGIWPGEEAIVKVISADDPLVEYDSTGIIRYGIPPLEIPDGFRMFLKNGHVYAEYIGNVDWVYDASQDKYVMTHTAPQVDSPTFDFSLSKVDLVGDSEYAIITVRDWVNGTDKQEKIFQVRLQGNPTNCYANDGTAGLTGTQYAPKLLFNWDWNAINFDTCQSSNSNYVYCDAAQFTTSLFKQFKKIDELKMSGKDQDIPKYTGFYAYLIRDNYTQEFLNDYDQYYSTAIATASSYFNTTESTRGYDQLISDNRIKFNIRNGSVNEERGNLSIGGLYRVELSLDYDNPNVPSLFDNNSPNVTITVTFSLIKQAPNYNPFYETPFDGEVGKSGSTYVRKNYGAGLNGGELKLNSQGNILYSYTGALTNVNLLTSTAISDLDKQDILSFNNGTKTLKFYPAQPTPILMEITGNGGAVSAQYKMAGNDYQTTLSKKWKMVSSSIGTDACRDFANQKTVFFYDTANGGGVRSINWANATKSGTVGLSTVFFTPKLTDVANNTTLTPVDITKVKLYTSANVPSLTSASTVILNYYGYSNVSNYDTLQWMFDAIKSQKVCMTQSSENNMRIWWNKDYLSQLEAEATGSSSESCS